MHIYNNHNSQGELGAYAAGIRIEASLRVLRIGHALDNQRRGLKTAPWGGQFRRDLSLLRRGEGQQPVRRRVEVGGVARRAAVRHLQRSDHLHYQSRERL